MKSSRQNNPSPGLHLCPELPECEAGSATHSTATFVKMVMIILTVMIMKMRIIVKNVIILIIIIIGRTF
jgi:hypothetical protein